MKRQTEKSNNIFFQESGKFLGFLRARMLFILGALVVLWLSIAIGVNLSVGIFLVLSASYLSCLYKDMYLKPYRLTNLVLLYLVNFVTCYYFILQSVPVVYLPFSAIAMISSLLFGDLLIAFFMVITSAITIASISGSNLYVGILFSISGLLAALFSFGARKRSTIIRAGLMVGLLQALTAVCIDHFRMGTPREYFLYLLNGIGWAVIVIGILPVFEYIFRTITNIRLLELADFSNPILNRMMLEAPGTYHHSLIVGNLSEAACSAIGVNALLARIGAYYHDIGKLQKPEYFSENQGIKLSKHDALSPTMSKMVIINHVKEGIELARKFRLTEPLIDFIECHHGSSLVYYFYRRALESSEEDQVVKEDGFRYPGPKPHTKETAVVMLADSVEAAVRSLKDPAPAKIEELVHKIINNKFIDGQLDECDLTLKDLEKISSVFLRILGGIYHTRVTYPDGKTESSNKKPAKENPSQSQEDSRGNP
jgi:putative nucleotidyltransferase with HDIG domain